jgi:hypothetical protein
MTIPYRGYSLEVISVVLAGDYVEQVKRDDPEQFIAIGYLGNVRCVSNSAPHNRYVCWFNAFQRTTRGIAFLNALQIILVMTMI